MNNMKKFRIIRSSAKNAEYNMRLDEKIFNRYLEDGIGVFRVYGWSKPSFTYGFSQKPEDEIRLSKCVSDGVQVARRITGGGILFHNDEITYSFACNKKDVGEPEGVFVSYRNICKFLMRFYEFLKLKPVFALEARGFKDKCAAHPLCSASYEKYDITISGKKIGGNAQRRKRQSIFQHGSIPLSIDWDFVRNYLNFLPFDILKRVTSLSDELRVVPERVFLEELLIKSFCETFNVTFIEVDASIYETCLA